MPGDYSKAWKTRLMDLVVPCILLLLSSIVLGIISVQTLLGTPAWLELVPQVLEVAKYTYDLVVVAVKSLHKKDGDPPSLPNKEKRPSA